MGGNTINPRHHLSCPSCTSCMAGCCAASCHANASRPPAPPPLAALSLPSTPFVLWWSSSCPPPRHRHHVPSDECWEKRRVCGGGLSTRPLLSFSSLSLATFDCCVVVVVVVVVRRPSSGRHHLPLFVGATSAIILQQTTSTSSLSPSLPPRGRGLPTRLDDGEGHFLSGAKKRRHIRYGCVGDA